MTSAQFDPDLEAKKPDPLEDEAEVVANGGEDRVDGVALVVGEEVAPHTVAVLEMSDDGFDRGSSFHLPLDGRRDAALLTSDKDLELLAVIPRSGDKDP